MNRFILALLNLIFINALSIFSLLISVESIILFENFSHAGSHDFSSIFLMNFEVQGVGIGKKSILGHLGGFLDAS